MTLKNAAGFAGLIILAPAALILVAAPVFAVLAPWIVLWRHLFGY